MTPRRTPLVVGLLGGIGSGKSAVAAELARQGAMVLDADVLGHEALRQPEVRDAALARWPAARGPEGEVDRRALAKLVFADPAERRALEGMTHPWIKRRVEEAIRGATAPLVVLDAAVMLEAGWDGVCDRLVFVDAPREARLARVAARRGWSAEELEGREAAQLTLTEKRSRADHVIDNSSSLDRLGQQVEDLMHRWGLVPAGASSSTTPPPPS
jgi:dephospho-CoA kinase